MYLRNQTARLLKSSPTQFGLRQYGIDPCSCHDSMDFDASSIQTDAQQDRFSRFNPLIQDTLQNGLLLLSEIEATKNALRCPFKVMMNPTKSC